MLTEVETFSFGVSFITSRGSYVDDLMEHSPSLSKLGRRVLETPGAHPDVGVGFDGPVILTLAVVP
jgi:hypothetical protein